MKKLTFRITIDASPEKIWDIIIGKDTYPVWTSVFSEGSTVETDWKKGSKAIFGDGSGSGMIAYIEEHDPNRFLSIKHVGMINDGVEDTTSDKVKEWAGAHEDYTLTPIDGKTEWLVEIDVSQEWEEFMTKAWNQAQQKVKEMAEKSS